MRNIIKNLFLATLLIHGAPAFADFGDRQIDWTAVESEDFRDYAVRGLNGKNALLNQFWPEYWVKQRFLDLNLRSPKPLDTAIIVNMNSLSVNAFAMPGNFIGLHLGLWEFADTEDEFLSVLAHEMSHLTLDHFLRLTDNQSDQRWLATTGIILAILFAQENADIASAAWLGSMAAASQNSRNFSQAMELEADQYGQELMEGSEYDPTAARSFFQRLSSASLGSRSYEFLQTHPYGSTRAARLDNQQPTEQSGQASEPTAFDALRYFILQKKGVRTASPYDGWQPESLQTDPNVLFGWYEHEYSRTEDTTGHLNNLDNLITAHRGFLPAYLRRLELLEETDDTARLCDSYFEFRDLINSDYVTLDVISVMREVSLHCQPNQHPEWYAQELWQSGQEQRAIQFLRRVIQDETSSNLLARRRVMLTEMERRYQRFR
ncbi:M48 family metallopeptidase [Reinekea marinisedimentorum]|uniref:Peptidase M48-like protein n=1 Tax=Reinekea marinisedimentorum TaxID=230495 RepID=A0A4R3I6S3_9GAMM|nr:M48 family metalloprotease [Reinekea marinisedimentorum]TCS40790.1 peptidase M48-like protein [Reinekea marinisedimentorum]